MREGLLLELQELVQTSFGKPDLILTPKTRVKDMGLTSLALVELICNIEEKYDVEIPNVKLKRFKVVGDVVRYLEAQGK